MPGLSAIAALAAAASFCLVSPALAEPTACVPNAPPGLLKAIAAVESGNTLLTVHDNPPYEAVYHPPTVAAAADLARQLIAIGHNPDLGPMQINAANLSRLGLTVEQTFDRCASERAAVRLLEPALHAALSTYNTGSPTRGIENGYVAKVLAAWFGPPAVEPRTKPASAARPALDPPASSVVAMPAAAPELIASTTPEGRTSP